MKKSFFISQVIIVAILLLTSCKNKQDSSKSQTESAVEIKIPIDSLETKFTEISVNPQKDSTYIISGGTEITILKGSLLDSAGNSIMEPVTINFRKFDDGVSIFLSGLPMSYSQVSEDMYLETAGMFEIRGRYKGSDIKVARDKPITVKIGSKYNNLQQGFFKLNDKTGEWTLVDIPKAEYNQEVKNLKKKIKTLKPRWKLPLNNYYVFTLEGLIDIYVNNNWEILSNKELLKKYTNKIKGYGITPLEIKNVSDIIKYKGNRYKASEMLWTSDKKIDVPSWVHSAKATMYVPSRNGGYGSRVDLIKITKIKGNSYKLTVENESQTKRWSTNLKLVTHLKYLVKYTPEQLIKKQKKIEKEITETEARIKRLSLVQYTTQVYSMGIYNCDRPERFTTGRPTIIAELNNQPILSNNIKSLVSFNNNLSSYSYLHMSKAAFFKGTNKLVITTKDGNIGIVTGAEFDKIDSLAICNSDTINLEFTEITVSNEQELRSYLLK